MIAPDPEAVMALSDFMGGLPLEAHPTDLERLKRLLRRALAEVNQRKPHE